MRSEKMKRIMKSVSLVLCILIFTAAIAGCTSKDNSSGDNGKIVISIADFADEKAAPDAYKQQMQKVAEFEAKYPNVKVENAMWKFSTDTFMAKAEGGTLPTLYYVPMTEGKKIMELGLAADITDEYEKRGLKNGTEEFMLKKISKNGKVYLFPESAYDVGIAVNIDLYKKAGYVEEDGSLYQPKTWEELAEVAKKIKETSGVDGFIIPTTKNQGGWRFTPIAWSYGTVFETKDDSGKWKASFDSPECLKALRYVSDLKWKYNVLPANSLLSLDDSMKQFAAGNAAMTFAESNYIVNLAKVLKMDKDNIGMIALPAGDKKRVTLMGGGFRVINSKASPEQIAAAIDYIEFGGGTCNMTEERKEIIRKDYELEHKNNEMIGLKSLCPWNATSEYRTYIDGLDREFANIDINHVKNYNDKSGLELQEEEPIDAQALYSVFDSIIQEMLTNKDADIESLLKKAAEDFQTNNLDYAE